MELKKIKNECDRKLRCISDIWTYYLAAKPFFKEVVSEKVWSETQTFTPSIGHFIDLLPIVFRDYSSKRLNRDDEGFADLFTTQIGFLQAIYVQQDLVEEMCLMLKLKSKHNKTLKHSNNRTENRNFRNEMIGHPINRNPNGNGLQSMVLFSYEGPDLDFIRYLKYDKKDGFKFIGSKDTSKGLASWVKVLEIQERHHAFIEEALLTMWEKVKLQLEKYVAELKLIDVVLEGFQKNSAITNFSLVLEKVELLGIDYHNELKLDVSSYNSTISGGRVNSIHKKLREYISTLITDTESTLGSFSERVTQGKKEEPLFDD